MSAGTRCQCTDYHRLPGHGVTGPTHHSLPELYSKRGQNKRGGPVSRVLYRGRPRRPRFAARLAGAPPLRGCRDTCTVRTIYLGRPLPAGSCSLPAGWSATPGRAVHLLLGFAPGEVYRAAAVAGDAVGSYPTFSPSPAGARRNRTPPAVCFLWHFLSAPPAGGATRALPGAMPSRSPDFPPPVRPGGTVRRRCTGPPLTLFSVPMRRSTRRAISPPRRSRCDVRVPPRAANRRSIFRAASPASRPPPPPRSPQVRRRTSGPRRRTRHWRHRRHPRRIPRLLRRTRYDCNSGRT